MLGRKCNLWKAGGVLASVLFLLMITVWVSVSTVHAQQVALRPVMRGALTGQATPTVDATVTALQKEQLTQEVQQLREQNDRSIAVWFWNSGGLLGSIVAALLAVAGVLWTAKVAQNKNLADSQAERTRRDEEQKRWLENQKVERAKRAEERFQAAVAGLGDEKAGARIGAAILLRTFLRREPDYEKFYTQVFDLAVANLRSFKNLPPEATVDSHTQIQLDTLRQALIVAFKEVYPLAREQREGSPQFLDANGVQLDNAYLEDRNLQEAYMPQASLRNAKLAGANLSNATLSSADLSGADLMGADLSNAKLSRANFSSAIFIGANFSRAWLTGADFSSAKLIGANFSNANLSGADFTGANLTGADLVGANLTNATLRNATLTNIALFQKDLAKRKTPTRFEIAHGYIVERLNADSANLVPAGYVEEMFGQVKSGLRLNEDAILKDTDLHGATGLTPEQLATCKAKGARFDDNPSASSSPPASPPSPPQSSNERPSLAQGCTPPSDPSANSAVSSSQDPTS